MIQSILAAFLTAVLFENLILARFLGVCPMLGIASKLMQALKLGFVITVVMVVASPCAWLLWEYFLQQFQLEYLQTIVYICMIICIVQLFSQLLKRINVRQLKALAQYVPVCLTNCAILGICILNVQKGNDLLMTVLYSIFAGIGFTLALLMFAGIRMKLDKANVPDSFKGLPISLISVSFVSMAFLGFVGLLGL